MNDSLNEWANVENQLKYVIQKSATSLYAKGEFSIAQKNQFYISSRFFIQFEKKKGSEVDLC